MNYSQHSVFWHSVSKKSLLIGASVSTIIANSNDDPEEEPQLEVPSEYSKKDCTPLMEDLHLNIVY